MGYHSLINKKELTSPCYYRKNHRFIAPIVIIDVYKSHQKMLKLLCRRLLGNRMHSLQYSCLENPMDGGAWKAAVHGVAEGRT